MIEAMVNCSRCNHIRLRLRHMPDHPGQWGRLLAGVVAAFWAATLWRAGQGMDQTAGVGAMIALFGRRPTACWMTAIAMLPIVDVLVDFVPLRVLGATLALITWSTLLLEMLCHDGVLRPTIGGCLVGLLGCLNADIRLAGHVAGRRR